MPGGEPAPISAVAYTPFPTPAKLVHGPGKREFAVPTAVG